MQKIKHLINKILKNITPPVIYKIFEPKAKPSSYGFFGNYKSWDSAVKECSGYDSDDIIEKTKNSALKVKNGHAVFERDSYIFDKIHHYLRSISSSILRLPLRNRFRLQSYRVSMQH